MAVTNQSSVTLLSQEVRELKEAIKLFNITVNTIQSELAQIKFGFRLIVGLYITLFAPVIVGAILFTLSKVFGP